MVCYECGGSDVRVALDEEFIFHNFDRAGRVRVRGIDVTFCPACKDASPTIPHLSSLSALVAAGVRDATWDGEQWTRTTPEQDQAKPPDGGAPAKE